MKLSPSFMFIPFLLGMLLSACNLNKTDNHLEEEVKALRASLAACKERDDKLTILENLFNSKDSLVGAEDGREVEAANADLCINFFPGEMEKHGFKPGPQPGGPVAAPPRARQITRSEDFHGKLLLEWLTRIVKTYDPHGQGDNVRIKVKFGIYTSQFLSNEHIGANLGRKKDDRIGVFLVPYNKEKDTPFVKGTGKVYDLGGLDP